MAYTKEQRKKAAHELDNMKTMGMMLSEAFHEQGIDYQQLSADLTDQTHYITPQLIKDWELDRAFPDITIIYKLSERYHLNPNELLYAKQMMMECGIASVNVRLLKNISFSIELFLWILYYAKQILPFIAVIVLFFVLRRMVP